MSAERVEKEIARARRKPMEDAKLRELLTKLRKGATGTLTFGKLVNVFDALGWNIEPFLGWSANHYPYDGKETRPSFDSRSRAVTERKHEEMKELESSEPKSPPGKIGDRVVSQVGEIKVGHDYGKGDVPYYFYYREWIACEGVTVTSSKGSSEDFLPNHHRRGLSILDNYPSSTVDEIWRGVKGAGINDDINKFLGTEAHIPAAQRTRENTGTCPACWGNFKLEDNKLVMHGYKRPGYGFQVGKCFATWAPPLELSVDGAVAYQGYLQEHLDRCEKNLPGYKNGTVSSVKDYNGRPVHPGDASYARLVAEAARQLEHEIATLKRDVEFYSTVISVWRERPLPKQGEPQRRPEFFVK